MLDLSLIEKYNKTRPFAADKFCYAPFTSLYFGHEGKVTACCENREHLLGVYPQNSIAEIWNGTAAQQLRQYISEQNLWHGCKGCDFDLRSENFRGIKTHIFDIPRMHQKNRNYPSMLEFEMENTCNLECVMCTGIFSSSIRKNRELLPPIPSPYDDAFVQQLAEFLPHLSHANFFGGEPFLVEIYYSIWEKMAQLNPGMQIWITTNGTILNQRVKDLLQRLRFNLTVSIDSLQKEVYEKIRVNAQFERVMENLKYFLQYSKSHGTGFTLNVCPTPLNWEGLAEIIQWGNTHGVLVNIIPVRNPEPASLRSLPAAQLKSIADYYQGFDFPAADSMSLRNKKSFEDYTRFVLQWARFNEELEQSQQMLGFLPPIELLKKRVAAGLNFSSESLDSRETRVQAAIDKLSRVQKKIEAESPQLAQAAWELALNSGVDDLTHALFTWDEDELLRKGRQLLGGEKRQTPG